MLCWLWGENEKKKVYACSEQCKHSRPTYIIFYLHLRGHRHMPWYCVEVRGQPEKADSLLPPYGSWALNSGPWACVFLPETLWCPLITFLIFGYWNPQMEKPLQEAHCINCRTTRQLESILDKFYGNVQSFPNIFLLLHGQMQNEVGFPHPCSLSSDSCLCLLGVYDYWSGPQCPFSRGAVCWQRG